MLRSYEVIETRQVDDQSLEEILNTWTRRGRHFDGSHFVMREASRHPGTALVTFTREDADQSEKSS